MSLEARFQLREKLGQGASSEVFDAYDRNLRRHVAIKLFRKFNRKGLLDDLLQPGKLTNGRVLDYNLGLTTVPYRGFKTLGHGGSLPGAWRENRPYRRGRVAR